jgi:hypothetical protein
VGHQSDHNPIGTERFLQRTISNQIVLRILAQRHSALPKLVVGHINDPLEHEADRVANQATRMADLELSSSNPPLQVNRNHAAGEQKEAKTPRLKSAQPPKDAIGAAPAGLHKTLGAPGQPLDKKTRAFFERRLGHDFSEVQVHTDESAEISVKALGAQAYTVGNHLVFGAGRYNPTSVGGRQLIAHELAHVVQQSRVGNNQGRLQPKLIASGDTGGFAAFANSVTAVQHEVVVSASGEVSIKATNVAGPPTREAQQLVMALQTAINDPKLIRMEFIHGATSMRPEDAKVLGGNYALSRVDLDDLSALGTQEGGVSQGRTGGSVLVHEVTEQYRKQVQGEAFPAAHAEGTKAEEAALGATRGTERYRQVNPTTLEVTIPYTYPDGHIVEVTWDIVNGNYGNVRRKLIPAPGRAGRP